VQRAQGNNGGVSTADAAAAFAQWSDDPTPVATCGTSEQSRQEAAQETLDYYFWELNQSDYSSAYAQLDPANHPLSALDSFIEGVKSSQDSARDGDPDSGPYYEVVGGDETGDENTVEVRFRSRQDGAHGPEGLTCADWHLRYSFVRSDGLELIHESSPVDGEPRYVACPAE
jgi:hypothetical protein